MPITIPIELGDVIRVGKFKNKRITVKEIGLDEYQLPTVNGKGIMKIRIEKLMPPKEPKQENNMNKPNKAKLDKMIFEALHSNDTQVKIKQKDKLWWICQEESEAGTDECLNAVGFETKEQAEHSALTKGYSFSGQEEINEVEPEVLTTKKEKVNGVDKVEDMKLDKEKEIKLEILRIAKKVIKEETSKRYDTFKNGDIIEFRKKTDNGLIASVESLDGRIPNSGNLKMASGVIKYYRDKIRLHQLIQQNVSELFNKKKIKINELEVSDPSIVKKIEEMAKLSDEMDRLKNELAKLKKQFEPLDEEITTMLEEVSKTGDRALETKTILVSIKKMGNPSVEVAAYKERFEQLYSKVNRAMKKQADEYWELHKTFKKIPTTIGVQYKQTEGKLNEESVFSRLLNKVKSFFSDIYNKIIQYGKISENGIKEMHKLTGV